MDAVTQVLDAYKDTCSTDGLVLRSNFASSAALAMLLNRGVMADLYLSANEEWADRVQASVDVSCDRVDLLGNELVLIVSGESNLHLDDLTDLTASTIRRIALADPFSVPAGTYAREVFQQNGIWQQIESRVAAAADVRRAMAMVEQGAADVGVVYATDASSSDGVKVLLEIPKSSTPVIYPLLHFKRESQLKEAGDLYRFFSGVQASEIFKQHGFCVLSQAPVEMEKGN